MHSFFEVLAKIGSVDAGWTLFKIEFVDEIIDEKGESLDGQTDLNDKIIRLRKDLCEANARETFFHEIVHIALEFAGFGYEKMNEVHNEYLATNLTRTLMTIFRLNPYLAEYNLI